MSDRQPTSEPVPVASHESFTAAMGALAAAVSIVTTSDSGRPYGCTATAIMSLSASPPTLLLSLGARSRTAVRIAASGVFTINTLARNAQNEMLAQLFASDSAHKFGNRSYGLDPLGNPLVGDAICTMSCVVTESVPLEDHLVFVGLVVDAQTTAADPLIYFRKQFLTARR